MVRLESPLVKFGVEEELANSLWEGAEVTDKAISHTNAKHGDHIDIMQARKLEQLVVEMNRAERTRRGVDPADLEAFWEIINKGRESVHLASNAVRAVAEKRNTASQREVVDESRSNFDKISELGKVATQTQSIKV